MYMRWVHNKKNKNYKRFHSRSFTIHLNDKIFQKTLQVVFLKPFSTVMDLDFYIFLATSKCQKNVKYIFQMKLLTARQRDNLTGKKTDT